MELNGLDYKFVLAIIAMILAIGGNVPYSIQIVRGSVKPHPYTWFVWSIVSGIVFFGQLVKGAGVGTLPTLTAEAFTFINMGLAMKYGYRKIKPVDNIFLGVSLAGIITRPIVHDPTIAVITAVGVDVIAFAPTIRKTWKEPNSETLGLYALNVLRHICGLFALESYNIATTLHSVAMVVTNSFMSVVIATGRNHNTKEKYDRT